MTAAWCPDIGKVRHAAFHRPLDTLMAAAASLRDEGHGGAVSYSRKVFIPITRLCRDTCHYCTFAVTPREVASPYLTADEVLAIARAGQSAGCREALFTLGDKPELRYGVARRFLDGLGYGSTIDYLAAMADLVFRETGLFAHANPGVTGAREIELLKAVSISQGLMLEQVTERLTRPGGPHHGSPDKHPARRLETIALAGRMRVPFTSGILIGIGETREERLDALIALGDLHASHGHLQEVIVQPFRAKSGTRMSASADAAHEELLWTIAAARLILGPAMNIQAPPNLSYARFPELIDAGINDWGGISPVTPDHVNPEAAWPQIDALAHATAEKGKTLVERLASYPAYLTANRIAAWHDRRFVTPLMRAVDATGYVRDTDWSPGLARPVPAVDVAPSMPAHISALSRLTSTAGRRFDEIEIVRLFQARGPDLGHVIASADALRASQCGDAVTYVVNRNINYTNICGYGCQFCAFSKGSSKSLRGRPYDIGIEEIVRRTREAWSRGATEVCLQGGIHPDYTGESYLAICRALREAVPDLHIHAFSPLEIWQGARTLELPVATFLARLKDAGLGTLPGTAAEILDDDARRILCPDKLTTTEWLHVVEAAHRAGLKTTATIMFGHIDTPTQWARHLLAIRDLQECTGGFTEFVPLPFVHMEAPLHRRGGARLGPTFRETLLMHAVARIVLHPLIPNIQASWVKLGGDGVVAALRAGANDLGGTLMNESISRAAGTAHGEELPPEAMEALIARASRSPRQRTTLYGAPPQVQRARSYNAPPLSARQETAPRRGVPARLADLR